MYHDDNSESPDWIYLCTPQHTGTHFVRFLLELHPRVAFWTCGRTVVDGWSMTDWQVLCQLGRITFGQLSSLAERAPSDLPGWTYAQAAQLELKIPEKHAPRPLLHSHLNSDKQHWHAEVQTVVTVRDPLVSVISALRRGSPEDALGIVKAFGFLSGLDTDACFWFCTDLWQNDRKKALGVLEHVGLPVTPEIEGFVSRWPALNVTLDGNFDNTDRLELIEARRWAIEERQVHPAVDWWARQIRETNVQPQLERLGYRDLAWFQ